MGQCVKVCSADDLEEALQSGKVCVVHGAIMETGEEALSSSYSLICSGISHCVQLHCTRPQGGEHECPALVKLIHLARLVRPRSGVPCWGS